MMHSINHMLSTYIFKIECQPVLFLKLSSQVKNKFYIHANYYGAFLMEIIQIEFGVDIYMHA